MTLLGLRGPPHSSKLLLPPEPCGGDGRRRKGKWGIGEGEKGATRRRRSRRRRFRLRRT